MMFVFGLDIADLGCEALISFIIAITAQTSVKESRIV